MSIVRGEHPLNRGLFRWWKAIDGIDGNQFIDISPIRDHITLTALPQWVTTAGRPVVGSSLSFNGTTQKGTSQNALNLIAFPELTISYWLNWTTNADDDDCAWSTHTNHNNNAGAMRCIHNSADVPGAVLISIREGGLGNDGGRSFPRPSAGVWHHYSIVLNLGAAWVGCLVVAAAYVDGVSQTLTLDNDPGDIPPSWNNTVWHVMCDVGTTSFGAGLMDDFRILTRTIDSGEAWQLYTLARQGYPGMLWRNELNIGKIMAAAAAGPPAGSLALLGVGR